MRVRSRSTSLSYRRGFGRNEFGFSKKLIDQNPPFSIKRKTHCFSHCSLHQSAKKFVLLLQFMIYKTSALKRRAPWNCIQRREEL